MKAGKRKRNAWVAVILVLLSTYYLSSIPGLRVLPVLHQVNIILQRLNLSLSLLVAAVINNLPEQLAPARTLTGDFYAYARQNPVIIEFLLRKTAHVFVFFVITIVLFLLFSQYLKSAWWSVFLAFLAGSALAVLDEIHQGFVAGRVYSVVDIVIDIAGVTMAVLMLLISLFLTTRWREFH
jgi:VanZ family protein